MADEYEDEGMEFANDSRAAQPAGDGLPLGNELTPRIGAHQVALGAGAGDVVEMDDDAIATIVWYDWNRAANWLDTNGWLAEFQYIDFLYQSPNYDRDWRGQSGRTARISRFIVAKNSTTLSTQIRRGVFADGSPFELEATGKFAGMEDVQDYLDAITQIFMVLDQRAELEYNMELFIDSQVLQGTALAAPVWETRPVTRCWREPKAPPIQVTLPTGETRMVHTMASDDYEMKEETKLESWPYFDFRRLGTTVYDPGWRTPNRPDLSAAYKIDYDRVTFYDLKEMRESGCYEDIPEDVELLTYFLNNPDGDAMPASQLAQQTSAQNTLVLHAEGENRDTSADPLLRPLAMLTYWTKVWVYSLLVYPGGKKIIRKKKHKIGHHALGMSATWWNISNSGYGMGEGRVNAGDQRMEQGMLNTVLKMIGYWTNAPLVYNTADGNAPTQNVVMGLGTMWGLNGPPGSDVRKQMGYLEKPPIPPEAWKIMDTALYGGAAMVGADQATMQGNIGGPGVTALRSAAGVNRAGSKADEQIATPIQHLEYVLTQWYKFLWKMVTEVMPITEIRAILSEKYADAIVELIDSKILLSATFNIKILAGQKLAARQAVAQIIPFLLQLVQQPQLLQYMHEKGWTINFLAIEKIFLRVSELKGAEDIIVKLSPQEQQAVQQMNPNAMKAHLLALAEKLKGQREQGNIQAKGAVDQQKIVTEKAMDHAIQELSGSTQLDNAEARLERNQDMTTLQQGPQV